MTEIRKRKLEHLIRNLVSELIMSQAIKDHRVSSTLSISRVEISNDFSYAKIFISSFVSTKGLEKGIEGLNHAKRFIRSQIAPKLKTRNIPHLEFVQDNNVDEALRINQLLSELTYAKTSHDNEIDEETEEKNSSSNERDE